MATFVLVHGAWQGGWVWGRVATDLRARGHQVFTPTLTGLGERRHLLRPDVGLPTHQRDVQMLLQFEGLTRAVMVGHGYGAIVVRLLLGTERGISRAAFIDPWPVGPGATVATSLPCGALARLNKTGQSHDDTATYEPPVAALVGGLSRRDADWVEERLTAFPAAVLDGSVAAYREPADIPLFEVFTSSRDVFAADPASVPGSAPAVEIGAAYLAMVSKPDAVAELLDNFARQPVAHFLRSRPTPD